MARNQIGSQTNWATRRSALRRTRRAQKQVWDGFDTVAELALADMPAMASLECKMDLLPQASLGRALSQVLQGVIRLQRAEHSLLGEVMMAASTEAE